jgi:hypothetical protein
MLNPKDAYFAVWLNMVERRNNLPSRLRQLASQLRSSQYGSKKS